VRSKADISQLNLPHGRGKYKLQFPAKHFCAIHSPKYANLLKVSPTCRCPIVTRKLFLIFFGWNSGHLHSGAPGLCPPCPPHCYATDGPILTLTYDESGRVVEQTAESNGETPLQQVTSLCNTTNNCYYHHAVLGRLGSRVVSVLDSGAEGPGFKSQSRRCRVTVLSKLFTPIVPLFTKQQNW